MDLAYIHGKRYTTLLLRVKDKYKMKIVYIHGAGATGESFNYIRDHLNHKDELVLNYCSKQGFDTNLLAMKEQLVDASDMFFIGHSLGGIYALNLAAHYAEKVRGGVTLSTPYGGSHAADFAKFLLPFSRLLRDIGPTSKPMKMTNKIAVRHPWCNVVSVRGDNPLMVEQNDGVVTLASMKHRSDMEFIEVPLNHYEIVISPTTVNILKLKLKEITKNDSSVDKG